MKQPVTLIKGDKVDSNVEYRDSLPVNMMAVPKEVKGSAGYMLQWYGLTELAQGEGVDRGGRWVTSEGFDGHYRISGNSFIKLNPDGTYDALGAVPNGGQGSIAFSFNNVAVVAGGNLYYYNPADGFRQITDALVGSPIDIVWADGVFIMTDGTDLYHSDPLDEENFLAADFGNAQFRPDLTNGLAINEDNELLAMGVTTTEYFTNRGAENFLYIRVSQKAIKLGISGTHAKKEFKGRFFVVGRREETAMGVHVIQGGGEESISTREIEQVLAEYSDDELSSVTIDALERDGLKLVIIHLPNHVFLYNETVAEQIGKTYAWSILKTDVKGDTPYRAKNFVLDGSTNKWICGDKQDSTIGYLDSSKANHYDAIAEWILDTPTVNLETLSINEIEIGTIPGFAPSDDATVFMSTTSNGVTWSKEYIMQYGANLDYDSRFIIRPMDYCRHNFSWRFRGASRSRMAFNLMTVDAS